MPPTNLPAGGDTPSDLPMEFDLGFGPAAPPNVTTPLHVAQAVATGLSGKLRTGVTNEMANLAVTKDLLAGKIVDDLQGHLGDAASTLVRLQHPIHTKLTGDLGSIMEGASRLGVVPPGDDAAGTMPAAVTIRTAALAGDLGPAFDAYRLTALPVIQFPGMQYAQAVQGIESALPDDVNIVDSFHAGIDNIKRQYETAPIGTVPTVSMPTFSTANGGGSILGGTSGGLSSVALASGGVDTIVNPQAQFTIPPGLDCITAAQVRLKLSLDNARQQNVGNPAKMRQAIQDAQAEYAREIALCGPQSGGGGNIAMSPQVIKPGGGKGATDDCTGPIMSVYYNDIAMCDTNFTRGSSEHDVCVAVATQKMDTALAACVVPPPPPPPPNGNITATSGTDMYGRPLSRCEPPWTNPHGQVITVEQVHDYFIQHTDAMSGMAKVQDAATSASAFFGLRIVADFGANLLCSEGYYTLPEFFPSTLTGRTGNNGFHVCVACPPACCKNPRIEIVCDGDTPQGPPPKKDKKKEEEPPPPPPPLDVKNQNIEGCKEFGAAPGIQLPNGIEDISILLGLRKPDGTLNIPPAVPGQLGIVDSAYNIIYGFVASGLDQLAKSLAAIIKQTGCANGQQLALLATGVFCDFVTKWTGADLSIVSTPNKQQRDYLCPTALPTAAEAGTAWLADTIDAKTLECWVRAAGSRYPEFKTIIDAARQKFSASQIGSLWLRGKLTDAQLSDRIRELGMSKGTEVADLIELLKVVPPPSDLVRFMVRDTDDKLLVGKFGMDIDFGNKYGKQIKEWAKSSGVSDEYMQYVWRAHWSIPSPGQLFDMLHRSASLPAGSPAAVSMEDVKTALEQQDILPFWIPKIINTSYRPLTRVDAKRAYQIGSLDEVGLKNSYTDQGYTAENAGVLVEYNKKQTLLTYLRSPIVNNYAKGYLQEQEFYTLMVQQGARREILPELKQHAMFSLVANTRKTCNASNKRRFLLGDIDAAEVQQNMIALGTPADVVVELIKAWGCEKHHAGKAIPTGTLASLYEQGAIDFVGLVQRLARLDYSYEDALLLARSIAQKISAKVSKEDLKQAKQQQQQQGKQQAQKAKDQATQQRREAKKQRSTVSMQRVNTLREKRLLEAAAHHAKHGGMGWGVTMKHMKSLYTKLLSSSTYLPDEIINAIMTASQNASLTTDAKFDDAVKELLQGMDSVSITAPA